MIHRLLQLFICIVTVSLWSAQSQLPTVQDYRYHKMLLKTARNGDVKAAEVLMAAKADVNGQLNVYMKTPLMAAASHNQKEFVQFLIKRGARVNLGDVEGRSALMYAALIGNDFEIVKILIAAGADPELMDNNGKTVYDYARKLKNARQVIYLIKDARAHYERMHKNMQQVKNKLAPIPEEEVKIKCSTVSEQQKTAGQSKSKTCVVM